MYPCSVQWRSGIYIIFLTTRYDIEAQYLNSQQLDKGSLCKTH